MPSEEEEVEVFQCPACGTYVEANETKCPKCGAEFEVESYECPSCHKEVSADDKVCPHCKAVFEEETTQIEEEEVEETAEVSEKEEKEIEEETEHKEDKETITQKPTIEPSVTEKVQIKETKEEEKTEEEVLSASELMALMEKDRERFESKYDKSEISAKKLEKSIKTPSKKDKFEERKRMKVKEEKDKSLIKEPDRLFKEKAQKGDRFQVKVIKAELDSIDSEYYQTSQAWKSAFMAGFIAVMIANITAALFIALSLANVENTQTGLLYFKYAFPLFFGIVAFTGGGYIFIYGKGNSEKINAATSMIIGLGFMLGTYVYFKKVVFVNSASAMTYYAEHKLITDIASPNSPDIGILSSSVLGFVFGLLIIACIVYGVLRPAFMNNLINKKSRGEK